MTDLIAKVDEKGRCCERKSIHYKGGSWASPLDAPKLYCTRCDRMYDPGTGLQRESEFWKREGGGFVKVMYGSWSGNDYQAAVPRTFARDPE